MREVIITEHHNTIPYRAGKPFSPPSHYHPERPCSNARCTRNSHDTTTAQVLLIHDPRADKEAAAMDVRVGSGSDPPNLLGLAHFCEHMLFLGSGQCWN